MVYFYGPDGAGKSSNADVLAAWLCKKGNRVHRGSVKQHHFLAYILLKIIGCGDPKINYYGFSEPLSKRIKCSWLVLEILSLFPAIFHRVIGPIMLGYIVVCDRYVLDSLATLSYFLKDPSIIDGWLAKVLTALIPRSSLLFWLDGDIDVLLSRKADEPLTKELLEYYRSAYRKLFGILKARGLNPLYIDTTLSDMKTTVARILKAARDCPSVESEEMLKTLTENLPKNSLSKLITPIT